MPANMMNAPVGSLKLNVERDREHAREQEVHADAEPGARHEVTDQAAAAEHAGAEREEQRRGERVAERLDQHQVDHQPDSHEAGHDPVGVGGLVAGVRAEVRVRPDRGAREERKRAQDEADRGRERKQPRTAQCPGALGAAGDRERRDQRDDADRQQGEPSDPRARPRGAGRGRLGLSRRRRRRSPGLGGMRDGHG